MNTERKSVYEEFLGKNHHERMRKLMGADNTFLPDSIIDAPLNIETMRSIVQGQFKRCHMDIVQSVTTNEQAAILMDIGFYFLAMVLCPALKSRSKNPDFVRYRDKNWDKRLRNYQQKALSNFEKLRLMVKINPLFSGPIVYN